MWRHQQGRKINWVSRVDLTFVVHILNLFCRSWWPLVWRCWGRCSWWARGPVGQLGCYLVKRTPTPSARMEGESSRSSGEILPGEWPDKGSGRPRWLLRCFSSRWSWALGEYSPAPPRPGELVRLGPLLKKSNDGNTTVQDSLAALHGHTRTQATFTPSRCMKHWKIARGKGTIPEVPNYLGLSQRQCSAMVYSLDTAGDSQRFF